MIRKQVSHYHILEKLGEGGMGVVYKAQDTKLKRTVALKFLPPELTRSTEAKKRFLHEAQAASALDHPNIGTIHEIDESEGHSFIVMAFVDGQSLKERIESGPLEVDEALDIVLQVAEGLQEAHEKGIVHRDIKPANIMMTSKGQAKILDFGLAKLMGRTMLTKTGTTLGTVAYMSPEQTRGEGVDHRTDIWALGVVLYQMLTGQLPFKGDYEQAVIYSIMNEEPEPLIPTATASGREGVYEELEQIVNKALAKEPDERYQKMDDLLEDLGRMKGLPSPVLRRQAAVKKPKFLSKNFWMTVILSVVVLSFILKLGQMFLEDQPGPAGVSYKNSIAVMYFENRSGEEDLDKILVDMLTTNLARYDGLEVVSSQRLFDILKNLGKLDAKTIDRSVATEVAQQAGVQTMLLGSIIQIGNKFRIASQLTDVETGNIIGSPQADGEKIEDIFAMVDLLTEELGGNLAVSTPEAAAAPYKIAEVTTKSLEAYKYYQKGLENRWRFENDEAKKNFSQAVAIDSTFAMAYLEWAVQESWFKLTNPYMSLSFALQLLRQAEKYSAKVTDKERRLIAATKALFAHDYILADSLFSDFVRDYAKEKDAYLQLSYAQSLAGKRQQSIMTMEKVLEIDPAFTNAYNIIAYQYSMNQEHEKAISAIKKYIALQPDISNSYGSAWDIYMNAGQFDEAIRICEQAMQVNPRWAHKYRQIGMTYILKGDLEQARESFRKELELSPKANKGWTSREVACTYTYEGRYQDAVAEFEKAIKLTREQGIARTELGAYLDFGKLRVVRGEYAEALELVSRAIEVSSKTHNEATDHWRILAEHVAGRAMIWKGDFDAASARADTIRALVDKYKFEPIYMDYHHLLHAESDIVQSRAKAAMQALERVTKTTKDGSPHYNSLLAKCYLLQGNTDEAIAIYRDLYNNVNYRYYIMGGDYYDYFFERSKVNYNLAKIYEQKGETGQAIEYYTKALEQWKNADPDLPELLDARARLAKLRGE